MKNLKESIEYAQKAGGQLVAGPSNGKAIVDIKSHPFPFAFELIEHH